MDESFEQWLIDTCSDSRLTEEERAQKLINWDTAPAARYCHPEKSTCCRYMFAMASPAQRQKECSNLK